MKPLANRQLAKDSVRWCAALISSAVIISSGCVRQVVSNRPGGSLARNSRIITVPPSARQSTSKNAPLDGSVTAALNQQAQGAFNPLTDDAVVRRLEAQLRLDSHDVPPRLQLAEIYERYGLPEQAFDQYERALAECNKSIAPADRTERGSDSPRPVDIPVKTDLDAQAAANGLARSARVIGRVPDAIPPIAAHLENSPSASGWNDLGILYDEVRDFARAEKAYRQAAAINPTQPGLHDNLGYNLLLQGKLGQAEVEFRRELELNPKSLTAHNNLGTVLAKLSDRDGAFEQFRLAATDDATAHNNLAVVFLEMGYLEKSRDELLQALSARYYFAPPMQNYKLVQELLQQRAQMLNAGDALPLPELRISPALAATAIRPQSNRIPSTVEENSRSHESENGMQSMVSKDGQ